MFNLIFIIIQHLKCMYLFSTVQTVDLEKVNLNLILIGDFNFYSFALLSRLCVVPNQDLNFLFSASTRVV